MGNDTELRAINSEMIKAKSKSFNSLVATFKSIEVNFTTDFILTRPGTNESSAERNI